MGTDGKSDPPYDSRPPEDRPEVRQARFNGGMLRLEKRWRRGDNIAVVAAGRRCEWDRQPPPEWVVLAVERLAIEAMPETEQRQRRDWHRHQVRWEALTELRERRNALFEKSGGEDDPGTSWERARAAVSERLEKTDYAGSEGAIKASYELVEAAGGKDATFESYKEMLRRRAEKSG